MRAAPANNIDEKVEPLIERSPVELVSIRPVTPLAFTFSKATGFSVAAPVPLSVIIA
jgi:hypothetical protein